MPVEQDVRKKANRFFFSKVVFNTVLVVLGAVLIALFLHKMQNDTALSKQAKNNEQALTDAVSILEMNAKDAVDLTAVFHDGNQDMLTDLNELFKNGLFDSLAGEDNESRSAVFQDMMDRSGVDYLFVLTENGTVVISPFPQFYGVNVVRNDLISQESIKKLISGTRLSDGSVDAALENNRYGYYYFYSVPCEFDGEEYLLVLGADAATLDTQISSLKDISIVLSQTSVGNNGFLFAVDKVSSRFLYYRNGREVLTGRNALEAGLSEAALKGGYKGIESINGTRYYCVSKDYGDKTIICAVADTDSIFANDGYVLFWSLSGFVMVMILCLAYAVIVRNDFVRHAVDTDKKIFNKANGDQVIFDRSIFRKVFPLMISGVLLIFGITFYTQTLLEISESIDNSVTALDEISARYEESASNRETIKEYYSKRFLSKARLIAYLLEEDPSVLNGTTARYHSYYDDDGVRHFMTDDEGNRLKSVASSSKLQELCDDNDIESIYIFDENGRTIATNTPNWFFMVSRDPSDQSYEFLKILDGRADILVQDAMTNDLGEAAQYIGTAFNYYTKVDENGNTVYVSRYDYENAAKAGAVTDESAGGITAHRAMVQIGLKQELSAKLLATTDLEYVFSTDMLNGGFVVVFDSSEDHICMYSPFEARIGMRAEDMGIPGKAFSGSDYYGFTRVNGVSYFQYYRYDSGYFIATAIPRSEMFQARLPISIITALTSLLIILILSGTVTLTTKEEEMLYATMSESETGKGLDRAIFNIILPSGSRVSTVKAAARWDNRRIPWNEKTPEQKLGFMISIVLGILMIYIAAAALQARTVFGEGSVIRYILSGNWDRGPNIFALSACMLVIAVTVIIETLFKLPVRIITSLLGARGETIGHLLLSIVKYGGAILVLFYCLYLVGIDSTSLLASAGVLSLVIGLGAQSLIKDVLAGIFIVFEGEFRVGDIVTINGYRGTVMDIGLRTTKILGVDGNIKIYNNSDISGVLNMTKEASIAICRVNIEYGQDIDYVEEVLKKELPGMRERNPKILEGPFYSGVSNLGDSGVELMLFCKCNEQDVYIIGRYMNREILKVFYDNKIDVPFPKVSIAQHDPKNWKTAADLKNSMRKKGSKGSGNDPGDTAIETADPEVFLPREDDGEGNDVQGS